MNETQEAGFETLCVHYAEQRERHLGAAAPPLFQSSTFTYPDCETFETRTAEAPVRYDYTRSANPTTGILESKIAVLERAEAARGFGSGMAAISAAVLSCVRTGDHVVTIDTVYGPTRTLFSEYLPRFGIETTYVRGTRIEEFADALRPNTRLIYLESPSSLVFELQDLAAVATLARQRGISTICDNSNATPYFQNPITFGIDLVVHSATKYISGHSDLVAGLVVGSAERMRRLAEHEGALLGGIVDPFAAWLMLRGLRTLAIRMERHQVGAIDLARFLEDHPRIRKVHYPGLPSHFQADLARRQARGHSGMLSFELRDPTRRQAYQVVNALRYFCIAVSWGGYESLAIPSAVTDPVDGEEKWVIRLSVGLENVADLRADLKHALG